MYAEEDDIWWAPGLTYPCGIPGHVHNLGVCEEFWMMSPMDRHKKLHPRCPKCSKCQKCQHSNKFWAMSVQERQEQVGCDRGERQAGPGAEAGDCAVAIHDEPC